ncbi:type II secretion system protein [Opitutaceae bacterium TAV4]|nr:type II secretion system protein [Opitutaceae bacterium TAV4]RRK02122.1 type II secretion system protein [Opitutaceae bacterium TAV3]
MNPIISKTSQRIAHTFSHPQSRTGNRSASASTSSSLFVSKSAFTLIELLAVIVIIGILAALTLTAISRVRTQARAAKCLSNIRQYCLATSLYATDHQGILPCTNYNQVKADDLFLEGQDTAIYLMPYMNVRATNFTVVHDIIDCTEKDLPLLNYTGTKTRTYGFNNLMNRQNLNAFTAPSRQVWIMDMADGGRWIRPGTLKGTSAAFQLRKAFPRPHMGKLGVGFLDGHAQLRRLSSLTWDMFARDATNLTTGLPTPWDGVPILTPEKEAAEEAAARAGTNP